MNKESDNTTALHVACGMLHVAASLAREADAALAQFAP